MRLAGRAALVTGASSGIGAGISVAFAREGARIALVGRDAERLAGVEAEIHAAGAVARAIVADVHEAAAEIVAQAVDALGSLNILVHSAGVFRRRTFAETPLAELDEQWRTNVRAPFALTQAALPHLRGDGVVIFVSSMVAAAGGAGASAYTATKGAVEALSRALAVELSPEGVRVNCIAPGAIETPMNERFRAEDRDYYELHRDFPPARRWGRVEDIAPAAVFLASREAAFVHGATIAVDGGWNAK